MKFSVVLVTLGIAYNAIAGADPPKVDTANGDDRLISSGLFVEKGLNGGIVMKKANDGEAIEAIISCDLHAQNEADLKVGLDKVAEKITSPYSISYSESSTSDPKIEKPVFPEEPVHIDLSGEGVRGEMSGLKGTKGEFHVAILANVNGKNMEEVKTKLKGFANKLLNKFRELEETTRLTSSTGTRKTKLKGHGSASGTPQGTRRLSDFSSDTGTGVGAGSGADGAAGSGTGSAAGSGTKGVAGSGADGAAGSGADGAAGSGADGAAGSGADGAAGSGTGSAAGSGTKGVAGSGTGVEAGSGAGESEGFPYFEPSKSSTAVLPDGSTHSEPGKWGYTPETVNWNALFPGCKGGRQSPIDILTKDLSVSSTETLQITGDCKTFKLATDHEHTYQWDASESTCQVVTSKDALPYTFKQFHIHTPSEHRVNGEKADMEVHFVHTREKDGKEEVLVIAALFNRIHTMHTISYDVQQVTKFITQPHDEVNSRLYPKLLKSFDQFYYYQGSLTTPPCTEGVEWYIVQDSFGIGSAELATLMTSMNQVPLSNNGSNKRSIQPLNARQVVTATASA